MNVTFDPAKDAVNMAKHGFSLLDALGFEWETAVVWPDTRRDYGEPRMVALGYIGLRIMSVVFIDRPPEQPTERRIISLRKANARGEALCRNLKPESSCRRLPRMRPLPPLRWRTLTLFRSPMLNGSK